MVEVNGKVIDDEEVLGNDATKKRTPKQYRCQQPKMKDVGKKLTMAEKKLFKEAFITDKERLHKRQQKCSYSCALSRNFQFPS